MWSLRGDAQLSAWHFLLLCNESAFPGCGDLHVLQMPTERRAACWLGVGEELSRAGLWAGTPPWTLSLGTELSTSRSVNQQHFSLLRYCASHWGLKQSCEILNVFRYWYCWSLLIKELYHKELIRLRNLLL